jgi:hypothetical protein
VEVFLVCILNYGEYRRKYELECESSLNDEIGIMRGFAPVANADQEFRYSGKIHYNT